MRVWKLGMLYRDRQEGTVLPKILVLDERTANQIAAGEVVERPASVVKELVENSLDAGAQRIVVEVEGGGRELIRITDDGSGMSPEDAHLALLRHATSKIRTAADLLAVGTLGFRGEAIPSIASISRFELVTREPSELGGYRIAVEGGHVRDEGEFGCPSGTRITVQDLFFNVPARLKYLKTNATELGQVSDALTRLALANPHVAFRFHSGQAQVFATPGTGKVTDAAVSLLGRELVKELMPVEYQDDSARVWGFVGRPGAARAGRTHQYFFVNHRAVRTLQVRYALEEAFTHLLPNGRYPVCIIFIDVPQAEVDVNVHPAKAEVKFERERAVRGAVYKAVRQTLGAHLLIPGTSVTPDGELRVPDRAEEKAAAAGWLPPGATRPGEGGGRAPDPPWAGSGAQAAPGASRQVAFRFDGAQGGQQAAETGGAYQLPEGGLQAILEQRGAAPPGPEVTAPELWTADLTVRTDADLVRSLRPLGQVHRSYIACDGPEGLYLIDQHAAHERIFFERLFHAAQKRSGAVQRLLFPISLDLTPTQMGLWRENTAIFHESGFEAEPFGGSTLLIQGVPTGLGDAHTARLVSDFLDRLQEERVPAASPVAERRQRVLAAMAACKAAIKARDALQPEDILALLADLAACQSPTTCPHGRPTVICVGTAELEKRFKR